MLNVGVINRYKLTSLAFGPVFSQYFTVISVAKNKHFLLCLSQLCPPEFVHLSYFLSQMDEAPHWTVIFTEITDLSPSFG